MTEIKGDRRERNIKGLQREEVDAGDGSALSVREVSENRKKKVGEQE